MIIIKHTIKTNILTVEEEPFQLENNITVVRIDWTDTVYEDWIKYVSIQMSDDGTGVISEPLGTGAIVDYTLLDDLLVDGYIRIQATAVSGSQIKKFSVKAVRVKPSLQITAYTPSMTDDAFIILQGKVFTLENEMLEAQSELDELPNLMHLNGSNSAVDEMTFDTTPTSVDALLEGQLRWNPLEHTMDMGMGGAVQQIGKELMNPLTRNNDTVTINNGRLVMYDGTIGNSGVILIKRATSTMTLPGMALGIATEDIAVGQEGLVTWFGLVRGIATNGALYGETWVDGEVLYNGLTPGSLSKVKPVAPRSAVMVGIVMNAHASNGTLFVRPLFFPFLWMLSDVKITNPVTGDVLVRASDGSWVNSNRFSIPRWDDLQFPLTQTKQGSNYKPDIDYNNVGLLFPQNDPTEIAYIIVQLPHTWIEGSDIRPHVHIIQSASQQATFRIQYKWYNLGESIPASWSNFDMGTYVKPYVSGSIANIVEGAGMISGAGKTISSILKIKLFRLDNVYVGDILADQFDIHIQIDGFGSSTEFVK